MILQEMKHGVYHKNREFHKINLFLIKLGTITYNQTKINLFLIKLGTITLTRCLNMQTEKIYKK